jgi:hypothetical protein
MPPVTDTEFTYDNLIAGDFPRETVEVTLLSGANLVRGTVLGRITASGKVVAVDTGGDDDGRRSPYAVLAEDVDASAGDKVGPAYLSGDFNEDELVFGGSDTKETHRAAMRDLNLYLKAAVSA